MDKLLQQIESISTFIKKLDVSKPQDEIISAVLRYSVDIVSGDAAAIAMYDVQCQCLMVSNTYRLSQNFTTNMVFRIGGMAEKVLEDDQYVVSNDFAKTYPLSSLTLVEGIRCFICLPITTGEEKLGIAYVYLKNRSNFEASEITLLQLYYNAIALFLSKQSCYKKMGEMAALTNQIDDLSKQNKDLKVLVEEIEDAKQIAEKKINDLGKYSKHLEQTTKKKNKFLASVSHELRTPLTAIIGYCELLHEESGDFQNTHYVYDLKRINSAAYHLLSLINNILDLSKIEADKIELESIHFQIRTSVNETISLFAEDARHKQIELLLSYDDNFPNYVEGDPTRIKQIIMNLISNAIKFTIKGHVSLHCSVKSSMDDWLTLLFEVADTGIGIPEAAQNKIFEDFTQATSSDSRNYGGTGLGLPISKGLVELMSGEIRLEKSDKNGSFFYFTIKIKSVDARKESISYSQLQLPEDSHVLLVDCNEGNRVSLRKLFKVWGLKCDLSWDLDSTLANIQAMEKEHNAYDLIIVDKILSQVDGFELIETLKESAIVKTAQFMMMTDFGLRGDGKLARDLGVSAYLTRPVNQMILFYAIKSILNIPPSDYVEHLITKYSIIENNTVWKGHVILIKEAENLQDEVCQVLLKSGYWPDIISTNLDLPFMLRQQNYQMIIIDAANSEVDFNEFLKDVRMQPEAFESLPVLCLGNQSEADMNKLKKLDLMTIILPPYNQEELEKTVSILLAKQ